MANASSNNPSESTVPTAATQPAANMQAGSTTEPTIPFAPTKAAFLKHETPIRAVAAKDVREARVDLNSMCVRTFTILPLLREMRPQIVAKLPDMNLAIYDSIEERTYAVHYCNTLWQAKVSAKENVTDLAESLTDWYVKALSAYETLITFDLASSEPKSRLQGSTGYGALTNNLGTVLGVLRSVAPDVLSQTPIKQSDLEQIESDLLSFQAAWGAREYTPSTRDEASLLRSQAFTYLYDAYELARRAALYLHGYDDGDKLVPSLYASLGDRPKKGAKNSGTEADTPSSQPSNGQVVPGQTPPAAQTATIGSTTSPATHFVMDNSNNPQMTSPFEAKK